MIDFFYSDPHFGHANIIKHASRPFRDVFEMDQALIANYCEVVSERDMVLWCGDCTWDLMQLQDLLHRLPGRKGLVIGNHDKSPAAMARCGFDFVTNRLVVDLDGVSGLVSHYPPHKAKYLHSAYDDRYADRKPKPGKGVVVVHGHTHEPTAVVGSQKRVHVGVDAWNFAPAPFESVVALAKRVSGR